MSKNATVTTLLLLIAIICFVLAVFSVSTGVALIPLGLAFFAAAFLPGT